MTEPLGQALTAEALPETAAARVRPVRHWLHVPILAGFMLVVACSDSSSSPSSSSSGASGSSSSGGAGCTAPDDLCGVLPVKDVNDACAASLSRQLEGTDPTGTDLPTALVRNCTYDSAGGQGDPSMHLIRLCYKAGSSDAALAFKTDRDKNSGTQTTEIATGIGEEAFYRFNAALTDPQELVSRQGAVILTTSIQNATGSRETVKVCLAAVAKRVHVGAP